MKPKILVPFDFSASADGALAWAADLQRTCGAGPIQMIHAISIEPPVAAELMFQVRRLNDDEIAGLERTMKEAAARHGCEATVKVMVEPRAVGEILLDAARKDRPDLIVMGTHGRTGVKRLLLGSIAEHILRHADCPVVTVHARAEAEVTP
jgi:universal stress protein A